MKRSRPPHTTSVAHDAHHAPHARALAVANNQQPAERLLPRYLSAVLITSAVAWLILHAMQQSAERDLTGQIDTLLPLARIGLLSTPVIVVVRAAIATVTAWLVAGALNDRITLRTVAVGVLTWLPLLELPALVDALSMLLQSETAWSSAHIPLGLDALLQPSTPRLQMLTQTVNLALVAFTALIARHLVSRVSAGAKVAVPTALSVAVVLAVLPLFRI